jgi:hypothetical protein
MALNAPHQQRSPKSAVCKVHPAKPLLAYLTWAIVATVVGLALAALLGWQTTGTLSGTFRIFFICAVLAVLEISLSFDNAIVNANKLREMNPSGRSAS